MPFLLDTSILLRLARTIDPFYTVADHAIVELHRRKELLHITSQNMVEFRNVATRPTANNGLGLTIVETQALAATYESRFPLLSESPDIYPAWKAIVAAGGVIGKRVHDARLVAVCHVHHITHLLTFNTSDFAGLASIPPGIIVVDPANV